ncbi:hypothetical protein [Mesorhizobium sp. B2-3-12]|uniref:hypothetical protein n=1 Tax=Mesorhizobium sp. B2-3-12 TaxID=2589952 RepID=UPI0011280EB3|nr:hypothetical protein [Mesorhizobium sp. B2-3-12]TPL86188.1 hypothetical protein FJ948_24460 [Mesorhizobium sp. B2-3-12]
MTEKATGRRGLGILEGAAIVLALAVASLAMAQTRPGSRECTVAAASASRDAAPANRDAEATDMLLHD